MSIDGGDFSRQVLPRWHTFTNAVILGEAFAPPLPNPKIQSGHFLQQKIREWQLNKTEALAADLVGNALLSGNPIPPEAKRAAEQLLRNAKTSTGRILAERVLNPNRAHYRLNSEELRFRAKIALLKMRISNYPHNVICWTDLAFYYAALGQIRQSLRAMDIALNLNSDNRFVLRSAASLFVHAEAFDADPEKALFYLRASDSTKHDPWLMASEIAVSDHLDIRPQTTRYGAEAIRTGNFSDRDLSELRSALGTLECSSGSFSKGKKLVNDSLIHPTENALAQAEWLTARKQLSFHYGDYVIPNSYEARSIAQFHECNFGKAIANTWKWMEYQPFSANPAMMGSYMASFVSEDYVQALEFVRAGLKLSPRDFYLNNNHAFCLASLGKIDEAIATVAAIPQSVGQLSHREAGTFLATTGLILYRASRPHAGRKHYTLAQRVFTREKLPKLVLTARIYMAREERHYDEVEGNKLLDEVLAKSEGNPDTPLIKLAKKIRGRPCSVKTGTVSPRFEHALDQLEALTFNER
ncbi:MAG: tetratricopeptide repeat protein [Lentisphaerae bacterium]|nr:tetratricopeptide repeat protein [Lentisphaerota bacterium]